MIEIITRDYLKSIFDEEVYLAVPAKPPAKYIVVEKTGANESNHIKTATLAVQSHASTMYEAMELSARVVNAMKNMITLGEISSVNAHDYNYTDTATKQYRYQATCEVVYFE